MLKIAEKSKMYFSKCLFDMIFFLDTTSYNIFIPDISAYKLLVLKLVHNFGCLWTVKPVTGFNQS